MRTSLAVLTTHWHVARAVEAQILEHPLLPEHVDPQPVLQVRKKSDVRGPFPLFYLIHSHENLMLIARSASRTATGRMSSTGRQSSSSASANVLDNHSAAMIIDLNKQIAELKVTVDGLEKERDFYFGKLRDIEILIQEQLESHPDEEQQDGGVLKDIQGILYNTEEGFEVPPEGEEQELQAGSIPAGDSEDETF